MDQVSSQGGGRQWLLTATSIGIAFALDLATPRGYADGFFYVLPVAMCIRARATNATLWMALGMTALIGIGDFLSAPSSVPESVRLTNQVASTFLVWAIALTVWTYARLRAAQRRQESLQRLAARLDREHAATRTVLAGWMHEGIAQDLAAIHWGLEHIALHAGEPLRVRKAANDLNEVIGQTIDSLRSMATRLVPPPTDIIGLHRALCTRARTFTSDFGVAANLGSAESWDAVPHELHAVIVHFVDEALANVGLHASANRVEVVCERDDAGLRIRVADDGRGISVRDIDDPSHTGLVLLAERVRSAGGELAIGPGASVGTEVVATFVAAQYAVAA